MLIHVVSHTHWDREWYHPAERFRQRLVALIDELLDDPRRDESFLLDGQTVVLEDYLDVRPERASEIADALKAGRLEAGPWLVLADELLTSGEGLVRNLLAGRRTLRALRSDAPPVLYCPDSFGHPAALPQIARGFGFELVILWRGLGDAGSNTLRWVAPNGESVVLFHLPKSGYGLGENLPAGEREAAEHWRALAAELDPGNSATVALLLNGADHLARQPNAAAAIAALSPAASPHEVRRSSLRAFAADLNGRASDSLRQVTGELRNSYGYTWTLQGTLASRTMQKRRFKQGELDLLRDVEPWNALAWWSGKRTRRPLMNAAWRPLLLCQPHDTLCGCSIDAVARAMDARLESVSSQAHGIRDDALLDLVGHDAESARRRRAEWKPVLIVRNRAARVRSGLAEVEIDAFLADVPVGPGSSSVDLDALPEPKTPRPAGVGALQVLDRAVAHDRVESLRNYPDNDAIVRTRALAWLDDVPAYGVRGYDVSGGRARKLAAPHPVHASKEELSNGILRVQFDEDGTVTLHHANRAVRGITAWESRVDLGDLYTPSIRGPRLTAELQSTRVALRGPLRGSVEQRWRLRDGADRIDVRLRFVLDAERPWLRLEVEGDNGARDHRLRLIVKTDVIDGRTFADAAFGVVERIPIVVTEADARMEQPVPTAPLHRYISLFGSHTGATIFADGLTEYETFNGDIALTVLRSVGELSRSDLPERPGHAGWPAPTPDAQGVGAFSATLALMLHGARSDDIIDEIEKTADDVLLPLTGRTLRSAIQPVDVTLGVTLDGKGLALSSVKQSEDGQWLVLRCVNMLDHENRGAWRLGPQRQISEARIARLDEAPLDAAVVDGNAIAMVAPARATVTILVR